MNQVIEVIELKKFYGEIKAVNGIDFSVEEGEIFGFLGPNGAGKTTTIKILCTLLKPTSGAAKVNGKDVTKFPREIREQIGLVFQTSSLDERLTGAENLRFHGGLYNMRSSLISQRVRELSSRVGLEERIGDPVKSYSGGMKRRLELIRGLLHHPRILFLDEPTLGLDPQTRSHIWEYIKELRAEEQITIFLTTHYMDEVEIANRVAVIDEGEIIALDTVEGLKDSLGGDVILLEAADNDLLEEKLATDFGISADRVDSKLRISVEKGEEFIPRLFEGFGGQMKSINLHEPTMDDVFLDLTGREIREGEPEKQDILGKGH